MKRIVSLLAVIALALSYLAAAKLGLKLAYVNDYTTAVWPPTGIALAALLLWGYRLWPGILIGAFLANITVSGGLGVNEMLASAGIACGNTLEALIGAYLVNCFAGGRRFFDRAQDVFRFAVVAALVSTSISATIGVTSLCVSHLAKLADAPAIWLTWWIGDAGGDLVFAPPMILCAADWRLQWSRSRAIEAGLLLLTAGALSFAAFTNVLVGHSSYLNLTFLCVPAMLWAAFRFGQRETAVTLLLVSGVAVWSWVHGVAGGESPRTYELLELQAYFCLTSLTLMAVAAEVSNRRQHEDMLQRLAAIVESSDDAMFAEDCEGRIVSWNAGAEKICGYFVAEVLGQPSSILLLPGAEKGGASFDPQETKLRRKDGEVIDISLTRSPIKSNTGALTAFCVVARDITDRKRMEEQFRQAQKLESIGLLAGGVAHDFNNLLVGILGNASLALDQLPPSHPAHNLLQDVVLASQRAAAVVSQLLTYAGRGEFITEPVQLPGVVREVARLVQPSVPKEVSLRIDLADETPMVSGDAAQIQQILMNLIINAAEAIGEKTGLIVVTLQARDIHQPYVEGDRIIRAGRYAALRVQDSGAGMDEKTRTRVFEPFFTTKFTGRGLGMAAVLGIVRRHQGSINVFSAPGQGATFEVLLPAVEGAPMVRAAAQSFGAGDYLM